MEFELKKHWWIIALAVVALYFIVSGKGFMGAALTQADQTLCTSTGGAIKYVPAQDTVSLIVGENNFTLKENNESYKIPAMLGTFTAFSKIESDAKTYGSGTAGDLAEITSAMGWKISIVSTAIKDFTYSYNEPNCACASANVFVSGTGCTATNNQSLCQSTSGLWNATGTSITTGIHGEQCVCPVDSKWKDGCMATVAKKAYCMDDLCVAEQTFNLLADELLPANCFAANQTKCKASLECTTNAGCSKETDAQNDCTMFWTKHKVTQAGTCTIGKCVFPALTPKVCTSSQLWFQKYIRWILAGTLALILILYLTWEIGPKRGFIRGKRK